MDLAREAVYDIKVANYNNLLKVTNVLLYSFLYKSPEILNWSLLLEMRGEYKVTSVSYHS